MNILIIGANGQLGQDMLQECRKEGFETEGIDFPAIDITNSEQTKATIQKYKPSLIINCAAYTAVDKCETEKDAAYAVNAEGVRNIALAALSCDAEVAHISTDYVFDGTKNFPYVESDAPNPQSVYGTTKLSGEKMLIDSMKKFYIFRIAWLYGIHGNNFVKTIRNLAQHRAHEKKPLSVVHDQFGTPTYTRDVCRQVIEVYRQKAYGIYHATNEGVCTWFEFAKHIVESFSIHADVIPCTTDEFPRPAPRPRYSVLENEALKNKGIHIMRDWKVAFADFLSEYKPE